MIILSDCLTSRVDEGCLKIASILAGKIKSVYPETTIISYNREPKFSDYHLQLNKLFLNKVLFKLIKKNSGPILYIPFASNTMASIIRIFILSVFQHKSVNAIFALRYEMNTIGKILLKVCKCNVVALSYDSYTYYQKIVGCHASYLKTGVNSDIFKPTTSQRKEELKKAYGIPLDKKVILHVGHLKKGRNIDKLLQIDKEYFVLLVVSSVTENERDNSLKNEFQKRPNTKIIFSYIENIAEVYQLSDIYFFPVQQEENCIDVPLSVLEAAACNLPVVSTSYGEIKQLIGMKGFYQLNKCDRAEIMTLIKDAENNDSISTRDAVLAYDWNNSIINLKKIIE